MNGLQLLQVLGQSGYLESGPAGCAPNNASSCELVPRWLLDVLPTPSSLARTLSSRSFKLLCDQTPRQPCGMRAMAGTN